MTLHSSLEVAVRALAAAVRPEGYWEGRLSSSALATATAISALALAGREVDASLIRRGIAWLGETRNPDGGWGDTPDSPSNLATTMLVAAALTLGASHIGKREAWGAECGVRSAECEVPPAACRLPPAVSQAESYLAAHAGKIPEERAAAIRRVYGADRTFAVPILTNCALAGLVPWECVPDLPFELAALPPAWFRLLRLHVVSYALPALIAIGMAIHHHRPCRGPRQGSPPRRLARRVARGPVLRRLERIQPESGGFLEAVPLTSFVAMSLAAVCGAEHPVVRRGLEFLRASVRADGSWPIDTNLSVWLTTSAITALARAGRLNAVDAPAVGRWIADRQCRAAHPYTHAAPGGWAWTHLSGGVPDGDDTSGAIVALGHLCLREPIPAGARWLLQLQNTDGGWPTFCRGWGHLPFDRSSPDITAHALRALGNLTPQPPSRCGKGETGGSSPSGPLARSAGEGWPQAGVRASPAIQRGLRYLYRTQRPDGAWVPLWFGSQGSPAQENPVLGTARVLLALAQMDRGGEAVAQGIRFLLHAQNSDGGWGGDRGVAPSVEETALAVSALAEWPEHPEADAAARRGAEYLTRRIETGDWTRPTPIGLYFASLWYSEELYPLIWAVEALGKVTRMGGDAS
ncbi:MAG: squalene--hopene cyclase [Armatimonadetes bacterium]|nr:squalene--hopene cyclase [Armatimonadota bacterium]